MLSDQAKLGFLAACLIGCLSTLFTSSSYLMGHKDLKVIGASLKLHCRAPRQQAHACLDSKNDEGQGDADQSSSCSLLLSQVTKCENSVKSAYQHINMGGCPREIQSMTVCEIEWCSGISGNLAAKNACKTECLKVKEMLDDCMKTNVQKYFARHGLQEDGTLKEK